MKIVEDDEERRENELRPASDEDEVGERFAQEERGRGRGRHALRVQDAVALLACPCLVERGDGGEEQGDPEDAAGDLAREVAAVGSKAEREDDDYQQGEEEHAVDGVAGAPFELEVFAQVAPDVLK